MLADTLAAALATEARSWDEIAVAIGLHGLGVPKKKVAWAPGCATRRWSLLHSAVASPP